LHIKFPNIRERGIGTPGKIGYLVNCKFVNTSFGIIFAKAYHANQLKLLTLPPSVRGKKTLFP